MAFEILRTPPHLYAAQNFHAGAQSAQSSDGNRTAGQSWENVTEGCVSSPPFSDIPTWEPATNVDGSPMVGSLDINGNPYGVTGSGLQSNGWHF